MPLMIRRGARRSIRPVLPAFILLFAATGTSQAAVEISTKPTSNVTCSGGVCTPTAKKAVLNVTELAGMLADGDVKVASGADARDIAIDAALSWTSTHRLTLDAYRSILFNKPVVVTARGALTIATNDGGSGGVFRFLGKGHVEFWDVTSGLIVNGNNYVLVNSLKQLSLYIRQGGTGNYALAKSLHVGGHTYKAPPINHSFGGIFEGLGNTISNMTIVNDDGADEIGLFPEMGPGTIRDVGLISVNINGRFARSTGALVGRLFASSTVKNSYATGQISGGQYIGGLIGESFLSAIDNCYTAVAVSGSDTEGAFGGLVGNFEGGCDGSCVGIIDQGYATGSITGGDGAKIGGLVGYSFGGVVTNSYATGAVSGGNSTFAGGLLGVNAHNSHFNSSPVLASSYSTGTVSGGANATVGGVIGQDADDSQISSVYWDLDTSGISDPSRGAGNEQNDPGITGLTSEQFKSGLPAGFHTNTWKEKATINGGYPYLIDLPPG